MQENIEGFVENWVNTKLENRNKRTPPHDDYASTSKKQLVRLLNPFDRSLLDKIREETHYLFY